jgi:hypothetical protein
VPPGRDPEDLDRDAIIEGARDRAPRDRHADDLLGLVDDRHTKNRALGGARMAVPGPDALVRVAVPDGPEA